MDGERLTYTVEEAARLLGISSDSAYSSINKRGDFPVEVIRIGTRILVPKAALLKAVGSEPAVAVAS